MPDQFALIRWDDISRAIAQAQDINDLNKLRVRLGNPPRIQPMFLLYQRGNDVLAAKSKVFPQPSLVISQFSRIVAFSQAKPMRKKRLIYLQDGLHL
jgi:hypothetical protein